MVSHGNLLANLADIRARAGFEPDCVGVSWLPAHHDLGLLGGLLQPLFAGFPSYLMSPVAFIQNPSRWLEAISRYRATSAAVPTLPTTCASARPLLSNARDWISAAGGSRITGRNRSAAKP